MIGEECNRTFSLGLSSHLGKGSWTSHNFLIGFGKWQTFLDANNQFNFQAVPSAIYLLAILQRVWIERYFYTFLYAKGLISRPWFDRVALGLLSLLRTFEKSSKCKQTSFD